MKKVLSIVAIAAMTALVACGPSAEEKAKMEADLKAKADSITAAMTNLTATADSAITASTTDTTATATTEEKK